MNYQIFLGDSLEVLKSLPSNSVDSLVTDPPAGIGLFGLAWDHNKGGRDQWISWLSSILKECNRVLKPGAHGFVWALPRTSHWTGMAIDSAGFQVKDIVTHVFGSGFPKSVAIHKAIDQVKYTDTDLVYRVTTWIRSRRDELSLTNKDLDTVAGIRGGACHWTVLPPNGQPHIPTQERWEKLETILGPAPDWMMAVIRPSRQLGNPDSEMTVIADGSNNWKGWGTALKPASEHWILLQKPISEHNIVANIKKYGVGGLNIDSSRIPVREKIPSTSNLNFKDKGFLWDNSKRSTDSIYQQHEKGRYPANLLLTRANNESCPAIIMNQQSDREADVAEYFKNFKLELPFIYSKKAGRRDRGPGNTHPTVKPLNLMRYFVSMVTPPNGTVLDPFMGSGSTGVASLFEKFQFIGIECNESYYQIADARLKGIQNDR